MHIQILVRKSIRFEENNRTEYGQQILNEISEKLTFEFGNGFTERNSRKMRQFYLASQIRPTAWTKLSWSCGFI